MIVMKKKDKQPPYQDDGHTVYNMDNVEGGFGLSGRKKRQKDDPDYMTKKERRALIKSAFLAYLPMAVTVLVSFVLVMLLVFLWLN